MKSSLAVVIFLRNELVSHKNRGSVGTGKSSLSKGWRTIHLMCEVCDGVPRSSDEIWHTTPIEKLQVDQECLDLISDCNILSIRTFTFIPITYKYLDGHGDWSVPASVTGFLSLGQVNAPLRFLEKLGWNPTRSSHHATYFQKTILQNKYLIDYTRMITIAQKFSPAVRKLASRTASTCLIKSSSLEDWCLLWALSTEH